MSLSRNAIQYTVNHLFRVALPNFLEPEIIECLSHEIHISLPIGTTITLPLLDNQETEQLKQGKLRPTLVTTTDNKDQIPVFTPATNEYKRSNYDGKNQILHLPYDFITISFLILSRQEEMQDTPRDAHNRFQYSNSLAHHYGFIRVPLVDEYAMLIRSWMIQMLPSIPIVKSRKAHIIPTHDIDLLYRFHNTWQAFRSIFGRDLFINKSFSMVGFSLKSYWKWLKDTKKDPYVQSLLDFITLSKSYGLKSIFFFKSQRFEDEDATYDVFDPVVKYCIDQIQSQGMAYGLHGSYGTYDNTERFLTEKMNLERVAGQSVTRCRQHYLRFDLKTTPFVWKVGGIQHDYTLGYAEQPGFRCGTCHPYPLYDFEKDCPSNLVEHPLIVMDGTFFDYLKSDDEGSYRITNQLYQKCQAVEGDFVILWHNHTCSREFKTPFQKIYLQFLESK